jgi:hypothetical protein
MRDIHKELTDKVVRAIESGLVTGGRLDEAMALSRRVRVAHKPCDADAVSRNERPRALVRRG